MSERPNPEMALHSRLKDLKVKKVALSGKAFEKGKNPKTGKMEYYSTSHADQKIVNENKKRISSRTDAEIKYIEAQLKKKKGI